MAISIGNSTTSSNTGSSTLTFSHDNESNNFLTVGVSHRRGADDVSGVTYNGVSMTRSIARVANNGVYIYELVAPASGSNDVVVTVSAGTDRALHATATSATQIKQSSPLDDTAGSSTPGSATSLSDSVTTTVADTLIVQVWQQTGSDVALTPSNITEVGESHQTGTIGSNHAFGYRIESSTGTYTSGWSSPASNQIDTCLASYEMAEVTASSAPDLRLAFI